jgi:SAM-dependent methyltransferase
MTGSNEARLQRELEHAELLLQSPEEIWGWGTPAGRARAARRAELIIEAGDLRPGLRTLEIGCGTGLFTQLVSRSGAAIDACELSEKLLSLAAGRTFHSPVRLLCGDVLRLELPPEGPYDVLWGSSVLHHMDLGAFLLRAFRLLKAGGCLVFAEPNMLNPQVWLERHLDWLRRRRGVSPDETAFYRWETERALKRAGFMRVVVEPHEFLHPAVPAFLVPAAQAVTRVAERLWPVRELAGSLLIRAARGEGRDHV